MGKWKRDRKDHYYKKAKSEDYRSRASFKLKQLNKKFRIIKRKDAVLDLGAAPGGWMQVAGELVGEKGVIVGVDPEQIEAFDKKNIISIKGDMTEEKTLERIKEINPGYDVVISDASPNISGAWDIDHFNSIYLARRALDIAKENLKDGGNFLVKVFQGSMTKEFIDEIKREFEFVKRAKPDASRQQSAEVYVVGKGLLRTPVKWGDVLSVIISERDEEGGGIAFVNAFKIIVEEGRKGEETEVKIKKVRENLAWAVKV